MKKILLLSTFIGLTGSAYSAFTITYNFDASINQANREIFTRAKVFWESQITGYRNGEDRTVVIDATTFDEGSSGGSIRLGSAGPRTLQRSNGLAGSFVVATTGFAEFNVNEAAVGSSGLLNEATVRHEVGHILGIGTLWNTNNVYVDGTGRYTGATGVRAYQAEFDPTATFVPVELDGGGGTADGHWNEVADNRRSENQAGPDSDPGDASPAPTVRFGPNAGRSLDDELLSGTLSDSAFLADTTLGSFQDIGFTTVAFRAVAVPEPSTFLFAFTGIGALMLRRRRY